MVTVNKRYLMVQCVLIVVFVVALTAKKSRTADKKRRIESTPRVTHGTHRSHA